MVGNSLIIQIFTAGLAIGIVMTYIQPTLAKIRTHQDDIAKVEEESARISEVNQRLARLYAQVNEIPVSDKAALFTYLPDEVDDVQVLKDLFLMAEEADVLVGELAYGGPEQAMASADGTATELQPAGHIFNLSFQGSYEQFKRILTRLEQNNYPLVVKELDVSPTEGGLLDVDLALVTYAHTSAELEVTEQ